MTSRTVCIWLGALAAIAGLTIASGLSAQDDAATLEQKLKGLMKERRDTLSSRVQLLEQKHELGVADVDVLLSAQIDLLDADLELATTKERRIQVLEQRVKVFRKIEDWASALLRAPRPPSIPGHRSTGVDADADMLLATADRMQAEIDLLREQLDSE